MSDSTRAPDDTGVDAVEAKGIASPTATRASPETVTAPILLQGFPAASLSGMAIQQLQVWQGQFPPPEAIEHYEQVLPGSFDRIMKMAERQQEASISAASDARRSLRDDTRRGHWLGWLVTVLALVGAVVCAFISQPWVAGVLVGVPVLSVAKALVDSARRPPMRPPLVVQQPSANARAERQAAGDERPDRPV